MLVMIDNYDSFTYNLVQYFGELGADVRVYRNDQITLAEIEANPKDIKDMRITALRDSEEELSLSFELVKAKSRWKATESTYAEAVAS